MPDATTPIARLDGTAGTFGDIVDSRAALVVNVASACGLTPQYAALQELHARYADRGFTVVGVPCNQFGGQEPGTADDIAKFCSTHYGVTFPVTEKIEVNGSGRHPLYQQLIAESGADKDIAWNFEKFLLDRQGTVVGRFGPRTAPDDPTVIERIESVLAP